MKKILVIGLLLSLVGCQSGMVYVDSEDHDPEYRCLMGCH